MNVIKEIIEKRKNGQNAGIASYCTANALVIEEALIRAKETNTPVLIEATANQVNQFGGYTGMQPVDFKNFVFDIAAKVGLDISQIILGGDHLGPLTWQDLPEAEAMENSKKLVYDFTRAGFTKIHLDTSMRVADDPEILDTKVIARRGVELYKVCMKAYDDLLQEDSSALRPVFIVGSEVPIPGGATDVEDSLAVTSVDDFENTIKTYNDAFSDAGIENGMDDVVAVVVQPGVEFGDSQVFYYNSEAAKPLCSALKNHPDFVFEGHSTDYQTAKCLKDMVNDGIAILKVGPAITFGLREALFQLSNMEAQLVPEDEQSHFIDVCEDVMLDSPDNWQKHYHGDERQLKLARKYSYSDRIRYYIGHEHIEDARKKLFANLEKYEIPMNMLHQYMPIQYKKVIDGTIKLTPKDLALDGVAQFMEDYEYATFN